MNIITAGIDLEKLLSVRPANRVSFLFNGAFMSW